MSFKLALHFPILYRQDQDRTHLIFHNIYEYIFFVFLSPLQYYKRVNHRHLQKYQEYDF